MLTNKERVTLAIQFATGYMQSGRSFPSFRDLAILGLDFVTKVEDEVQNRNQNGLVKAEVLAIRKIR